MTRPVAPEAELGPGDRGEPVLDLQRRLRAAGFAVDGGDGAAFGPATARAVHSFQDARGLPASGRCDGVTWAALVEAGYRLGDRLLYLRSPMLRGDDVNDLQDQLGRLGFDAGKVDGIFGPVTERALREFQRNSALTVDGVCGPDVLAALGRLGRRPAGRTPVASVRELEALRAGSRVLTDRRIVVGDCGGLASLAQAIARALRERGADTTTLHHPDGSAQARECNELGASLYVGVAAAAPPPCGVAFYATDRFASIGGRRLAELLAEALGAVDGLAPAGARGLRLPVLRETRMPAVLWYVDPVDAAVRRSAEVSDAVAGALAAWVAAPVDGC